MTLELDGYAILGAIAGAPELFPDIRLEAAKAARALVVRQIRVRGLMLADLRRIRERIGADAFALVLDGMGEPELRAVVGRLDRHHVERADAEVAWLRGRLASLAAGAEPAVTNRVPKPPARSAPRPARAPAAPIFGGRAFAAAWDGKDHDAGARKDGTERERPKKKKKK